MLQRTLSRQGSDSARRRLKPFFITLAVLTFLALLYWLLPEPRPRLRPVELSTAELRAAVSDLTALQLPSISSTERERAALGRKLFHDKRFSANGEIACISCHDPEKGFADARAFSAGVSGHTSKNSPSIVNAGFNHWFFWDGRADSLAAQALQPIEDPKEHGVSRTFVAQLLLRHYDDDYVRAFGPFPQALTQQGPSGFQLPTNALPPPTEHQLSITVAAYALATLGSFDILSDILDTAQKTRLAPAMELSRRAFVATSSSPLAEADAAAGTDATASLAHHDRSAWYTAWNQLSEDQRTAINQVFANFGQALAAFQKGLVSTDSPFDRFARRLNQSPTSENIETAFDHDFGSDELAGLQLFLGPGRCVLCHSGPNFTDQQFHNNGLAQQGDQVDVGRAAGVLRAQSDPFNCQGRFLSPGPEATSESCRELPYLDPDNFELVGAFKTPSLRNVALTAPYMHDGRFPTLSTVLDHYSDLRAKPAVGHREESLQALDLTIEEKEALAAFLASLTGPVRDINSEEQVGAK